MGGFQAAILEGSRKFLKSAAELEVLIVSHTDLKGALDYNRDLSALTSRSIIEAMARRLLHCRLASDATWVSGMRRADGDQPHRRIVLR